MRLDWRGKYYFKNNIIYIANLCLPLFQTNLISGLYLSMFSVACVFPICMVILIVRLTRVWLYLSCLISVYCVIMWTLWTYAMLLSPVIIQCCQSERHHGFSCMAVNGCCAAHCVNPTLCFSTSSLPSMFWFEPQGSESESVNGPGRDSGLASSRLEPSATLPSRGGAESDPETMEGMLCRKQEMESHSKKAATRWVLLL